MNRRAALIIAAAVASVVLLAALLLLPGGPAPPVEVDVVHEPPATPTPPPQQRIVLLFPGADGRLHPELRTTAVPVDPVGRARVVVTELLAGSASGLGPVLPYPAELAAVFVDSRGTAFVDLSPPPEPLGGSHTELLIAYGVVDSILLNCPELTRVQLLFGGEEVETLTGHLDLSRPLALNRAFIAPS
jgi:hypothetical protein